MMERSFIFTSEAAVYERILFSQGHCGMLLSGQGWLLKIQWGTLQDGATGISRCASSRIQPRTFSYRGSPAGPPLKHCFLSTLTL
jgi:hypothetical protein